MSWGARVKVSARVAGAKKGERWSMLRYCTFFKRKSKSKAISKLSNWKREEKKVVQKRREVEKYRE